MDRASLKDASANIGSKGWRNTNFSILEKNITSRIDVSQDTAYALLHQELVNHHQQMVTTVSDLIKGQAELVRSIFPRIMELEVQVKSLGEDMALRDDTLAGRLDLIDTDLNKILNVMSPPQPLAQGLFSSVFSNFNRFNSPRSL